MEKKELDQKAEQLKDYFLKRPDVLMAFIFGSYAKGFVTLESDFDLAVYFKPQGRRLEFQEEQFYPAETKIWQEIEKIIELDTDLVILNRARPTLAFDILKNARPLVIKDRKLYLEFYLLVSREAEDFRQFAEDYWLVYQRSKSLSEEDRVKIIERLQFLDSEIEEFSLYQNLDLKTYRENKIQRRNIERWIETLLNALIDIAKIILASQKQKMPSTYLEVLLDFSLIAGLPEKEAVESAQFAKLRNILAHEYLDLRFQQIKKFIEQAEPFYQKLILFVKTKMFE